MQKLYSTLKRMGLKRNEVKTYLALVKLGSSKAGNIAKETYLDRTSTYGALKSLLEKGLISYVIVGKFKWFQAADPNNLKRFLTNKLEDLEEILPLLNKLHKEKALKSNVRLFKGKKGIKSVLSDIIEDKKPNYLFGSEGQLEKNMPEFAKRFKKEIKINKISVRSLMRQGRSYGYSKNVRFVPKTVSSPVVTNIYGDKISLIIWSDPPEAILIENRNAAKAYRSYFEFMWEHANDQEKRTIVASSRNK